MPHTLVYKLPNRVNRVNQEAQIQCQMLVRVVVRNRWSLLKRNWLTCYQAGHAMDIEKWLTHEMLGLGIQGIHASVESTNIFQNWQVKNEKDIISWNLKFIGRYRSWSLIVMKQPRPFKESVAHHQSHYQSQKKNVEKVIMKVQKNRFAYWFT